MPDTFNISDVFISYSRKDTDFARRLFEKLKSDHREVWADWEDIPPTADWWAEVQAGIEGADTFVFVISPDSVTSGVCQREIDHAMRNNKRFVPILYREVVEDGHKSQMHGAISSHNWVYFRDNDDFDAAYQRLIASLETDLNHVRMHTRLLVRAREWDSRSRIPGFLLTGVELKEGQFWLGSSAGKEPQPTPLHSEYVAASRRTRRRQQALQIGLVAALVLSFVLLILAVSQANEANAARQVSVENAALAITQAAIAQNNAATAVAAQSTAVQAGGLSQSVALAAQSQLDLNGSAPERSLALSLIALESFPYTIQAERALGLVVQYDRVRLVLTGHQGATNSAAYSPDGTRLVTAGDDNMVRIWDIHTGKEIVSLAGHTDRVTDAVWSPGGDMIASASADQTIRLWDVATGETIRIFEGHTDRVQSVAFSPDGDLLVSASYDSTARVWDVYTGQVRRVLSGHKDAVSDAVFSPDGEIIATASWDYTVNLWNVTTGQTIRQLGPADPEHQSAGHNQSILSVAFLPGEPRLVTTGDDGKVIIWDMGTGQPIGPPLTLSDRGLSAQWSPYGDKLATARADGTVRIWLPAPDGPEGTYIVALEFIASTVSNLAWSPDNKDLVTTSIGGRVKLWDTRIESERLSLLEASTGAALFAPDSKRLLTLNSDNNAVWLWDAATGDKQAVDLFGSRIGIGSSAVWSPDGTQIAAGSAIHTTVLFDTASGERGFLLGGEQPAWSPDGTWIATINQDYSISIYDAATGDNQINMSPSPGNGHADALNELAWSPDSKHLVAVSNDGYIELWDIASGTLIAADHTAHAVNSAAFSPDGVWVAVGFADGTVQILPGSNLKVSDQSPLTLSGHTAAIVSVDWSPDGSRLVTASRDKSAKIWDVLSGSELLTLSSQQSRPLISADWSPDSKQVVTTDDYGMVRLWTVWQTLADLEDYANQCCFIPRLTTEERAQFGLPAD